MSRDSPRSEYSQEDERTTYEREDAAGYPSNDRTMPGFLPFGWPSMFNRGGESTEEMDRVRNEGGYEDPYDESYRGDEVRADEDEGTWLDEGLITLTLIAGVALFLFPEPATSGLGILLITVGVVAWLVDWAM